MVMREYSLTECVHLGIVTGIAMKLMLAYGFRRMCLSHVAV